MRKLMILGASDLQLPLIKRTKERGIETIVVSPGCDEVGKMIADKGIEADVKDQDTILRYASSLKINGIITDQTDIPIKTAAYVADKMNLPGIGYETACLFTNKFLMREKCKELGIKTLRYKMCSNKEEAVQFFGELGKKAIIKPIDNQGSRGVSLIEDRQKLINVFDEAQDYSLSKKVLIEEVAEGREFVVEGMALNYEFQNLIIGDTYYFNIPDVYSATQRIFPSDADPVLKKSVADLNKEIIQGFGLKQGITHSEFIMNGDDIVLIETAARGGGVYISSDLIPLSTGLYTEDFIINVALGIQERMPVIEHDKCACCYLAFYLPPGIIREVKGIDEVRNLDYTWRDNFRTIEVGRRTKPFTDKTSRYNVSISAPDRNELSNRINYIKYLLNQISVETDGGQFEGPIWD